MVDLLKRWHELEPERCQLNATAVIGLLYYGGIRHSIDAQEPNPTEAAGILAAVIEAIEARNGFWSLTRADFEQPPVGLGYSGIVSGWGVFLTDDEHHGTPAAALLSAYLAALEAAQ